MKEKNKFIHDAMLNFVVNAPNRSVPMRSQTDDNLEGFLNYAFKAADMLEERGIFSLPAKLNDTEPEYQDDEMLVNEDFKSYLNFQCQQQSLQLPSYSHKPHAKGWESFCVLYDHDQEMYTTSGSAKSKKEADKKAACAMLGKINEILD